MIENANIKKEATDELQIILMAWAKKNNVSLYFKESGGQIIIHFDKDANIRIVELHKVLFKI